VTDVRIHVCYRSYAVKTNLIARAALDLDAVVLGRKARIFALSLNISTRVFPARAT
jgi:hypothetical protein